MKKIIATLLTTCGLVALAILAATPAQARPTASPHECHVATGFVLASGYTSCAFANNIARAYARGDCNTHHTCSGSVYSPVTGERYHVFCTATQPVFCGTSGYDSWIKFYWHQ